MVSKQPTLQHNTLRNFSVLPMHSSSNSILAFQLSNDDGWMCRTAGGGQRASGCRGKSLQTGWEWSHGPWWLQGQLLVWAQIPSPAGRSHCEPAWASARTFHQAMVMSVGGRPHSWLGKYGAPVGQRRVQSVPLHTICLHGLCENVRQKHKYMPNEQSVPYYDKQFCKAQSWGWVKYWDAQCTWACPKFLAGSGNHKVIKQN